MILYTKFRDKAPPSLVNDFSCFLPFFSLGSPLERQADTKKDLRLPGNYYLLLTTYYSHCQLVYHLGYIYFVIDNLFPDIFPFLPLLPVLFLICR
jgi:hypothetical protein